MATSIGQPKYGLYSTMGASIIHWALACFLAVKLDMKMTGVAIATSIHFCFRFIIMYALMRNDKRA
jgi:Na+-driven multidrug efflux pump